MIHHPSRYDMFDFSLAKVFYMCRLQQWSKLFLERFFTTPLLYA